MDMVDYTIRVPKGMVPYLADDESGDDFERNALILYNPYLHTVGKNR